MKTSVEGSLRSIPESVATIKYLTRVFSEEELKYLKMWYQGILATDAEYIVQITDNSLALTQLLEQYVGESIAGTYDRKYLTAEAFNIYYTELAAYFRLHRCFPKIYFIDFVLLHGHDLNYVLEELQHHMCQLLDDFEPDKIYCELAVAISIKIMMKTSLGSLVINRYSANVDYVSSLGLLSENNWRKFMDKIYSAILNLEIHNQSYIHVITISKDEYERIVANKFLKTVYQSKVELFKVLKHDTGMFVVRILHNYGTNSYTMIPYVVLEHELGEDTYARIRCEVVTRYGSGCVDYFDYLCTLPDNRNINAFIEFLLSNSFLHYVAHKYSIGCNNSCLQEKQRLLTRFVKLSDSILEDLLTEPLFYYSDDAFSEVVLDDVSRTREGFDDKVYAMRYCIEKKYCGYFKQPYYTAENRLSKQTYKVSDVVQEIKDYLYLLQMSDTGIVEIVNQKIDVKEMALLIMPLRYYKYLPMLDEVWDFCELSKISCDEVISKICDSYPEEFLGISAEALMGFMKLLLKINQEPKEYMSNYSSRIDSSFKTLSSGNNISSQIKGLYQFLDKQQDIQKKAKILISHEFDRR